MSDYLYSIISFGKLGTVALLCCFGYVIYNANEKLQSGTIGTAFTTFDVKVVQGGLILIVGHRVARWQNLIPSFPWIAPGWRARGRNPRKVRDQILQCSVAEP